MDERLKIRLPESTITKMRSIFQEHFLPGDELWLFGSRVDLDKKGGDIDLYIETNLDQHSIAIERKMEFLSKLQREIGEQKIDVVLKLTKSDYNLPIYEVAKQTGLRIAMNNLPFKTTQLIQVADIHATWITDTIKDLKHLSPFSAETVQNLSKQDVRLTDQLVYRFTKLQDLIGAKLVDAFLKARGEVSEDMTMIDKINRLERLRIISDANLWLQMRDLRNNLAHEYPDEPETTAKYLNLLFELAPQLLLFLENIKKRI